MNEIKADLLKSISLPLSVLFEVTYKCNNKCIFCYNESVNNQSDDELSIGQFREFIQKGIFHVVFSGGEPLLSKNIYEYAYICKNNDTTTGLITNALLINKQNVGTIKMLFDTIQVSLHGNREIHDKITKNIGSFDKATKNIILMLKNNIIPNVNITLTKANKDYIPEMLDSIKNIGVSNFSITRFCNPISTSKRDLELSKEEFLSSLEYIEEQCILKDINFLGIFSGIPLCIIGNKNYSYRGCSCGHSWLTITPRGDIKVCPAINESFGHINNINEVWNNGFIREWRNLKFIPDECKNCINRDSCRGGCRSAALNKYNNMFASDPLIV